ncbi:hypothetical protein QBC38DRAFT_492640 [Podospora fimiseda]|uniref:Uncharacterized protein n=1 Tax=Podospora fimiseda TaxID=252190 RepID=A0AAN6YQV6_9PEZI|nr:hypothetical protein QBC38DRAFT_492640 [Podospora fimiseda]
MSKHFTRSTWLSMLLLSRSLGAEVPELLKSAAEEVRLLPPTPTPTLALRGDIAGRQVISASTSTTTYTLTGAPDMTCGFLSGSSGNPITCANGKKCQWEAERVGAIFCGFEQTDRAYVRCVPRSVATDPSLCNDVCQSNSFNLICTNTNEPYCRTLAFPDGVRDFRCASSSLATAQAISWSYSGQVGRVLTTSVLRDETTSNPAPLGPTITFTPTRTSQEPIPTDKPITTGPSSTGTPEPEKDDGPPLGPIIGGAVGGVAVLALVLAGIFFLVRRSRREDQNIQGHPSGPPPPNQPSPVPTYTTGSVGFAGGQVQQNYYDPAYKPGLQSGNLSPTTPSMMSMSPPSATHQEFFAQGDPKWGPGHTPSPPPVQPGVQPYGQQVGGGYPVQPQQAPQGGPIYEIGTVDDQHRGRLNELH